jgi:uncharacterized membrane protein YdfJ with MMPL/SSD domain
VSSEISLVRVPSPPDVLILQLVVAPAVLSLLGHHDWWLPRWLDRKLPDLSIDGHLVQSLDATEAEPEKVPGLATGEPD